MGLLTEDDRRYSCDVCGRSYRSATALGDHKHKHTGLTVCPLCRRASSNVPNLRTHLRSAVGSPRKAPYECDVCGRRYKHRTSLHDHRQRHDGRTVCPVCGTAASTVYNLRLHLRNVHRLPGEQVRALTGYGARRAPAPPQPVQAAPPSAR
ncbi:Zinc finger protein 596 [Amphibalanus amphitrite]|uniref:Zinc finger protein 596 n=1 Tax=Amphibalanus amphitrite TaxID=1232801 RepID=A0A6A4VSZ5_AMPAM|nr:Zinc finger protein 596 [Amphibalanus amphitrite]